MTTSHHWGDQDRGLLDAWTTHGIPDSVTTGDMLDMLVRLYNRHRRLSECVTELVALIPAEQQPAEVQGVLW